VRIFSPVEADIGWNIADQLTTNTASDSAPCISGDGTKIAFSSDVDGDFEIFVVNSDGSGHTQLTTNTAYDGYPSISGDGSKVAFESYVDGDSEIFIINMKPPYDLSDFPVPFTVDTRVIIPVSDPHGPCGAAHTMDTMGGVLVANRLGLEGAAVETAMDSYGYISTYDGGSATVTMTDISSNLIVFASCGVNQVSYYYNMLTDGGGSPVLPVLFHRDAEGDYLYVQSSTNIYRIEFDGPTVTADYGVIQIIRDGGRYVLLVYGLGGEASKAAAEGVSDYDQWGLTGQAAIVKYYGSDANGYLDTIEIVETIP
jgi:hypothetical protein